MSFVRQWQCAVCGYIHEGDAPPDPCPVCGSPLSDFEPVAESTSAESQMVTTPGPSAVSVVPPSGDGEGPGPSLFSISYGLYMVSSRDGEMINGQTNNTLFQITADPTRIVLGINKANLTHDYLIRSGLAAVTVLNLDGLDHVRHFGFQSGRTRDKFKDRPYQLSPLVGCPVLPNQVAYLECQVVPDTLVSLNTHTMFVCDVVGGGLLAGGSPMTYSDYRRLKNQK